LDSEHAGPERDRPAHLCGWVDHPDRHRVAASLPRLAQAGADLAADPTTNVLLYKVWELMFAGYPDYPAQQIGDCVSFGHAHGHDLLMTAEAYRGDIEVSVIHRTCTEFIYGESRKVGGMLGPFDGSYAAAAVKAMTTVGYLSYGELAEAGEATSYSGKRAKAWGWSGPPGAVEALAGRRKLGAAALVRTWDELVAAIANGYPVTVCSDQGFSMTRDQQGFCAARGRWSHCMVIGGVRFDRPGACILQSWGPDMPSGPRDLDQPSFSFWAERPTVERMLAAGDSFALSQSPGFAARSLPSELTCPR
jgi:hypothetical protein